MTKAINAVFVKDGIPATDAASAKYAINVRLEKCNMHPRAMQVVGTAIIVSRNGQKLATIPFDVEHGDPFEKAAQVIADAIQKAPRHEEMTNTVEFFDAKLPFELRSGTDIKDVAYHEIFMKSIKQYLLQNNMLRQASQPIQHYLLCRSNPTSQNGQRLIQVAIARDIGNRYDILYSFEFVADVHDPEGTAASVFQHLISLPKSMSVSNQTVRLAAVAPQRQTAPPRASPQSAPTRKPRPSPPPEAKPQAPAKPAEDSPESRLDTIEQMIRIIAD